MPGLLKVRVISPERVVHEGEAEYVQYPGEDGLYGILPQHASMITTVDPGTLLLREPGGHEHRFFVSRGFVEVAKNELHFAVESGEDEENIDIERAREAARRARERLHAHASDVDLVRVQQSLRRALMRLRTKKTRLD